MTRVILPTVDVHLGPDDLDAALRADIRDGLTSTPKDLPPKWLYDENGSDLFDQITRLAEYYPTEAERSILLAHAADVVERTQADTIVELGSGTSDKTRALLDAATEAGTLQRFIPFDVSEAFLREAALMLAERYPGVQVHGVVGDFDRHLDRLPSGGRRLVMLLGGTIGNYPPLERKGFLTEIVRGLEPGDHVLLGTDLIKDVARMEVAYDDPQGVSAAFAKNVLAVINRELDASFELDAFEYVARWDPHNEWIEMGLRSRWDQTVTVDALDLVVPFATGELMRNEVSTKFDVDAFGDELAAVGLDVVEWYLDDAGDFGVSLSVVR
ncbi:MAG: L-histidine N(alpha)-methyltransferase [Actinomycetota bacterium]